MAVGSPSIADLLFVKC